MDLSQLPSKPLTKCHIGISSGRIGSLINIYKSIIKNMSIYNLEVFANVESPFSIPIPDIEILPQVVGGMVQLCRPYGEGITCLCDQAKAVLKYEKGVFVGYMFLSPGVFCCCRLHIWRSHKNIVSCKNFLSQKSTQNTSLRKYDDSPWSNLNWCKRFINALLSFCKPEKLWSCYHIIIIL